MRKKFIYWLFEHSQTIYTKFKRKKVWNLTTEDLLSFPVGTFGNELGKLLQTNGFELIPKAERHDAYHLLTGFGTAVEDEIALQYTCFGNGKRSPYLFGVIIVGTLVIPDYFTYYLDSYKLEKNCNTFHHFDYKKLLNNSLTEFRNIIFNKQQILKIQ